MRWCASVVLVIALLQVSVAAAAPEQIDLSTLSWTLSNERGYKNVSGIPGQVPGNSFTDLMAAGVIDDPYYRYNDMNYRWVSLDNWTYSATLELTPSMLNQHRIVLWFEGLDTVSTIYVNGQQAGQSDNMFRRYIMDIKPFLTGSSTSASLRVEFVSAAHYGAERARMTPYHIPQSSYKTELPHRNFVRKSQCHFAWDWGPCFLTQGVWLDASVYAFSDGLLQYVSPQVTQEIPGSSDWTVTTDVWMLPSGTNTEGTLEVSVYGETETLHDVKLSGLQPVATRLTVQLPVVATADLWYPRGYGEQPLFPLTVTFHPNSNSTQTQTKSVRIGFRTVQMRQTPISGQIGETFEIVVNNVPVFAKGANWVPLDAFESRVNDSFVYDMVQSAYDANMNILRNWGGGIYQRDSFYERCDELGILVWEEFMFACSMYPRDQGFLTTVQEEVKHQVLRLMSHPSIIIWSGNNENELALNGWYKETKLNPFRYVVDYNYLNTDTLYRTVQEYDPSRVWLPSSPSNGIIETEPYVERWGQDPGSSYWGDVHFYDYTNLCTNMSIYPSPRFASEYGFQSYPLLDSLEKISIPEDWSPHSPFMVHRQHHPKGNEVLDMVILQHFRYPNSTNQDKKFSDWLYLTQCVHALCLRVESEHYRRSRDSPAHTMGAIYWQLNSVWQAPTWSSIEYGNRWKIAHYYTSEFFAPTIISSYVTPSGDYVVHVTTDSMVASYGTFTIEALRWRDGQLLKTWTGNTTVHAHRSPQVFSEPLSQMLNECGASETEVAFLLDWKVADGSESATNQFFLTTLNQVALPKVQFAVTVSKVEGNEASLSVSCSAMAPFTFVETNLQGRFSNNGMLCVPNRPIALTFTSKQPITSSGSELAKSFVVRSIQGTYQQ